MSAAAKISLISKSGRDIYHDPDPDLLLSDEELQDTLRRHLIGKSVAGMPIRTRSKHGKNLVAKALGYPEQKSFKKTAPRFPGQNLDLYLQKSNNLQIWNQEVEPDRRYALVSINAADAIDAVRVVRGELIAELDKTGTLTSKYQARLTGRTNVPELVTAEDTTALNTQITASPAYSGRSPTDPPYPGELLPITTLFERCIAVVGQRFPDAGIDQERNRGADLHRLLCAALGYNSYADDGSYPDIRHQLLEVKLQTSPTIDVGLHSPSSDTPLNINTLPDYVPTGRDVRYAVCPATSDGETVTITGLILVTGEGFYGRFPQFQGKVTNRKIQIRLPSDFFSL